MTVSSKITGNLYTQICYLIVHLITDTPGKYRNMIPVAANHIGQISLTPFFKEVIRTLEQRRAYIPSFHPFPFGKLPFIVCFVQHQQS